MKGLLTVAVGIGPTLRTTSSSTSASCRRIGISPTNFNYVELKGAEQPTHWRHQRRRFLRWPPLQLPTG